MRISLEHVLLRRPEPADVEQLYVYRNDPEITNLLGGFSTGYAKEDLRKWIEMHRLQSDEVLFVIADKQSDKCLGHVGLYKMDHRVRSAEFAILVGDREAWGKGIGTTTTHAMLTYGFDELNLHRIYLEALRHNERAMKLYEKLGFQREGVLRHAQFRQGRYLDVQIMSMLEDEFVRPD